MKIVVFAGTTEGKEVSEIFANNGFETYVTVATEYGKDVFEEFFQNKNINLLEGRLNIDEMKALIRKVDFVADATHPYAVEVSKNIVEACKEEGKNYLRIVRENNQETSYEDTIIWAENQEHAIEIMNGLEGNILLTTGSKDLPKYASVNGYVDRLFPRILPDITSVEIAMNNGYKKKNIICMQGPFSHEINVSMMKMIGANYILTKETGDTGGYKEKLSACKEIGGKAIVIKRPIEEVEKQKDSSKIELLSAEVRQLQDYFDSCIEFDFADFKKFVSSYNKTNKKPQVETIEKISDDIKYPRFPLFLDLKNKRVVVVGSGKIAQRRINTLAKFGALVTIISPNASKNVAESNIIDEKVKNRFNIIDRVYIKGDLEGSFIAVASTNNRDVNHDVYNEAKQRKIFVSVADSKDESMYYFPAIWCEKDLSIGIVGDGTDHKYVRKSADLIRETIDKLPLEDFRTRKENEG